MSTLPRPCLDCGDLTTQTRCDPCTSEHQRVRERARVKTPDKIRKDREKYGSTAWRKLSEKARKIQKFCSDCGSSEDLTCEHTAQAWQRVEQGKVIRLRDVDVLCRSCNGKRGKPQEAINHA